MKAILSILISMFLVPHSGHSSQFKKGDLVFASMPCRECPLIEATTHSPYSHVGMLDQDQNGNWVVIQAVQPIVMEMPYDEFVQTIRGNLSVMGMWSPDMQAVAEKAALVARQFIGIPYDSAYEWGADRLYCSELVYFSFLYANEGKSVFDVQKMTFEPFTAQWTKLLGGPPPEGKPGLSPGDIARSPLLVQVR